MYKLFTDRQILLRKCQYLSNIGRLDSTPWPHYYSQLKDVGHHIEHGLIESRVLAFLALFDLLKVRNVMTQPRMLWLRSDEEPARRAQCHHESLL